MDETGQRFPNDVATQLAELVPTATRVLTDPKGFFADMPREGGFEAPAAFAAAMLVADGVILALLSVIHLHAAGFFAALIMTPIFGMIGLLIGAAILLFLSQALGGEATFESSFRIVAYSAAIGPIRGVAQIVPYLPILVSAYGFYLAIVAVIAVHRVPETKAWRVIGGIAAVLLLLSFVATVSARRVASRVESLKPQIDEFSRRVQEQADEMKKAAEKMQQEMQRHEAQKP